MGSALTSQIIPMQWIMEELKLRKLYFLDSRTTNLSVAARVAEAKGVPYLEREFFLDNTINRQAISQKLKEVVDYAKSEGLAVAIGHPYPQTLTLLSERIPEIERNGIDLIWASEVGEFCAHKCQSPSKFHTDAAMAQHFCHKNPVDDRMS